MPNKLQQCILGIAKDLDAFCKKYGIEYYLMGGSALGALRHKGFIPWDDDLDVFMTVDNYDKFLNLFEKYADNHKYFLQKQNTQEWPLFISQVCLKGTTMISDMWKNNMKQHHNVFIDIMCLYSAPTNVLLRHIQFYTAQLLKVNALELSGYPQKNIIKKICMKVSRVVVNNLTRSWLIRYVRSYEYKNTEYVGHFFGRARFNTAIFRREYIGHAMYVKFEDAMLPVFEGVEDYLVSRFGVRWMDLPSQETIKQYPQHGDFVDLERDFTEYLTKDGKNWNLIKL